MAPLTKTIGTNRTSGTSPKGRMFCSFAFRTVLVPNISAQLFALFDLFARDAAEGSLQ